MERKTVYSDKLPRKVRGKHRCQALNMNGNRCHKLATTEEYYHGDNELYDSFSDSTRWVAVKLCVELFSEIVIRTKSEYTQMFIRVS